ncbi:MULTISPECIES: ABC transporter substrate-binding protein [unclassified Shinella]|uniref:ABC transporter substrate-binding protein n=1 Tax=unclassified Shinella TaxID=2643062 RepID=UPI00225C6282|nr:MULTISPECIES: ABC transporter substrate-binding protein [unclassified Shinella]MCO5138048.1 ABC transporter substrate-binding protein [Shinella sp.]MDC7258165.1 ABC transporter substrate-binding protein [Shinella sp. YE25]CAI0335078.1 Alkanesulfonates-binding protein [Rhizobiaceae bacterium]CAK7259390.1 sulfonate transport system substrate-binding protein [Shinella sp. WSC3-e]
MSINRRMFVAALTAVIGFAAVQAMPLQALAAEKPSVIRLASFGNAAGKPYGTGAIGVLRAQELLEKEFAADGISIEWQFPRGTGPAINEAIANGQLDFAYYGGLPNIVGRGAGLKTKVVSSYGVSPSYVVARPDAKITSIADLKGKKVATSRGTINELSLFRILGQAGLTPDDIQFFDLQTADQIAAITSGDIDAVVGGGSSVLQLVEQNIATVVFTTKGSPAPGSNFGSFVVTDAFREAYPDLTQRVVNKFVEASYFASDEKNREALFDIWALTGSPRSTFEKDYADEVLKDRQSPLLDDFYRANVTAGVDFAVSQKLIRKPFDVNEWVDDSYLKKALKDYGYENVWTPRDSKGNAVQF